MGRGAVDPRRWTLFLVVLLAVGFGVVAAFIGSPDQTGGTTATHRYTPVPAIIFVDLLLIGGPTLFALWLVYRVIMRIRYGSGIPARYAALPFLVTALVVVGILALAGVLHQSAWPAKSVPAKSDGVGSAGTGGTNVNITCPNCTDRGNATAIPTELPAWALPTLAAIGAAITGISALMYAVVVRRAPDGAEPDARGEIRRDLIQALRDLADGPSEDPREVVRALYARMLLRLQLRIANTDPLTPREIERTLVSELGVRAGPAELLTRIFEEARYSERELDADKVEMAREALRLVIMDFGGTIHTSLHPPAQTT